MAARDELVVGRDDARRGDDRGEEPALVEHVLERVAGHGGPGQHDPALTRRWAWSGRSRRSERAAAETPTGWVRIGLKSWISGSPAVPVIRSNSWPRFGLRKSPRPRRPRTRIWRLPPGAPVPEARSSEDVGRLPGPHLGPGLAGVDRPPDAAGAARAVDRVAVGVNVRQRGVDDDLAVGRELRVDRDLEAGGPHEHVVALARVQREQGPRRVEVGRAVEQDPGRPAVHRAEEADARDVRTALSPRGSAADAAPG